MESKPVTAWYKWCKSVGEDFIFRSWEYNHLEGGHAMTKKPVPHNPIQKQSWPKSYWCSEFGYLVGGVFKKAC